MWPPHAPTNSHRRPIGRFLGAGFDMRLLALRQVHSRRLRPVGRLTCASNVDYNRGSSRCCKPDAAV